MELDETTIAETIRECGVDKANIIADLINGLEIIDGNLYAGQFEVRPEYKETEPRYVDAKG